MVISQKRRPTVGMLIERNTYSELAKGVVSASLLEG
jgi:hypothetical protein